MQTGVEGERGALFQIKASCTPGYGPQQPLVEGCGAEFTGIYADAGGCRCGSKRMAERPGLFRAKSPCHERQASWMEHIRDSMCVGGDEGLFHKRHLVDSLGGTAVKVTDEEDIADVDADATLQGRIETEVARKAFDVAVEGQTH